MIIGWLTACVIIFSSETTGGETAEIARQKRFIFLLPPAGCRRPDPPSAYHHKHIHDHPPPPPYPYPIPVPLPPPPPNAPIPVAAATPAQTVKQDVIVTAVYEDYADKRIVKLPAGLVIPKNVTLKAPALRNKPGHNHPLNKTTTL